MDWLPEDTYCPDGADGLVGDVGLVGFVGGVDGDVGLVGVVGVGVGVVGVGVGVAAGLAATLIVTVPPFGRVPPLGVWLKTLPGVAPAGPGTVDATTVKPALRRIRSAAAEFVPITDGTGSCVVVAGGPAT